WARCATYVFVAVFAAVPEAERGSRCELAVAEAAVEPLDVAAAAERPEDDEGQREPEREADERRQHDEHADGAQAAGDEHAEARLRHGGGGSPADQSVGRA